MPASIVVRFALSLLVALASAAAGRAQVANEFDFDSTQLAVTTIPPNGAVHTITTPVTYTGQNLVLHAALRVRAGGELRLVRSILNVHGHVTLEDGGRITVIDSEFLIPNQYQTQREMRVEGGLLHTERATIGAGRIGGQMASTGFLLLRGSWLARQTVVQGFVMILSYGRTGWEGNGILRGGSLHADGLYEGDFSDGVHVCGQGDATLVNGTMNVGFYIDAGESPVPLSATLDLDSRNRLHQVYGDPAVHPGITAPFADHLNRLELRNHRVPTWYLFCHNASSTGPLHTITLRNAEDIICNFRGHDLVGSPILAGPWSSHYAALPGLPSTQPPGFHAMPPGCSVQLGNVLYRSGPSDWNRIRYWGLYTEGAGTNLTIAGPTSFAEVQLFHGSRVQLFGTGGFDMGMICETVRVRDNSILQMTNVALGVFPGSTNVPALIEVADTSSCTITHARAAPIRLRTIHPGATIVANNLFGRENVIVDTAGGGSVQVVSAQPAQSFDLQNLGFESPLVGGLPPFWAASAISGASVNDAAPGAPGNTSFALTSQGSPGTLQKVLTLPPDTMVSVIGAAKVVQAPPGGAQLTLQTVNGANVRAKTANLGQLNSWQRLHVPLLTVGTGAGTTAVQFVAGGQPATVRLDDFRVQLGNWWEADNLGNLGFELGCRFQGFAPDYASAPDCWRAHDLHSEPDALVRPGAAAGSRSVRTSLLTDNAGIYKDMNFFRAGDQVTVRGWARGSSPRPGAWMAVFVGNGPTFYVVTPGGNQMSQQMAMNGTWQQWQINYTVPNNPQYTRIYLGNYDAAGGQTWWDDITVEIQ